MAVFTNQATLSYSGGVTNSNITTGELVESVSVTKDAVSAGYAPGDSIAYVISIVNNGTADLTDISVTDNLGGYSFNGGTVYPLSYVEGSLLCYVGGVLQPTPAVTATDTSLVVSGLSVPAESNATLIYEAAVTRYAPLGTGASVTNTASVTGAGTDLTAQATVPAAGEVLLTVSKSASSSQVSLNGQLSYSFVIQNSGSEAAGAEEAITLTDTFDPILNNLTVTSDGQQEEREAFYTYNQQTGAFATIPGQITVPAATFTQNADGSWTTNPGVTVITVTGTV